MITIRRIQMGEAGIYKQIRLSSLQEAPYAFSSTYESALGRSDQSWQEQVNSTAQGNDRVTLIAFSGEKPIGIAALYRLEDNTGTGELLQVWVSPDYRGSTVAGDLIDAIFKWADKNNFEEVTVGVKKDNPRGIKFYVKYGFSMMNETSEGVYLTKEVN